MEKSKKGGLLQGINLRTYTMIFILVLLWIGFTVLTSNGFSNMAGSFIAPRNISNLLRQMAVIGVMSVSMVLVIVTGGIDLSVGSLMGFCGVAAASLMRYSNVPVVPAILIALAIGAVVGLIQGWIIANTGVPPFIVTLGGQLIFRGAIIGITRGTTVSPLPQSFLLIGQSYLPGVAGYILGVVAIVLLFVMSFRQRARRKAYRFEVASVGTTTMKNSAYSVLIIAALVVLTFYKGIPTPVLIMLALMLLFTFISEKTTFGRQVYAIGGNTEAARYSGINVARVVMLVYLLNGILAGLAGVMLTSRLNAAMPSSGESYELDAIAACVIGGTSMSGGSGKVAGALLGALIMASITNGMSMMNLESFWQYIVKGSILVAAVWFDVSSKNKMNKVKQA